MEIRNKNKIEEKEQKKVAIKGKAIKVGWK